MTLLERVDAMLDSEGAAGLPVAVLSLLRDVRTSLVAAGPQAIYPTLERVLATTTVATSNALLALAKVMPVELVSGTSIDVVASRVADDAGIARSVVVNMLGKLELAGVVRCRSMGANGTRVTILVPELRERILDRLG